MRFLGVLSLLASMVLATSAQADTSTIYRAARDKVFQIRILEASSATRAAYGSGFLVDGKGDIVTNFHVVADLVDHPGQYVVEAADPDGRQWRPQLISFDAINDLALLRLPKPLPGYLSIAKNPPAQGTRLYSIGVPLDQGFSISEGTYNGLIPDALTPRIHFTGPINPGVSGGPVVDGNDQLVGVNVSTMGNSEGHLVPAAQVVALLAGANGRPLDSKRSRQMLTSQLTAHQADFVGKLLGAPWPRVKLGEYSVPGQIAGWMKCWADNSSLPANLYKATSYLCYPGTNEVFVSEHLQSGTVALTHEQFSASSLGRQRFAWLLEQHSGATESFDGAREDAGNFQCQDGFIKHDGITLNTSLCVRALRKLPGLYDAAIQGVSVAAPGRGLISRMTIRGASFDNVLRLSRKFVEQIAWKP